MTTTCKVTSDELQAIAFRHGVVVQIRQTGAFVYLDGVKYVAPLPEVDA